MISLTNHTVRSITITPMTLPLVSNGTSHGPKEVDINTDDSIRHKYTDTMTDSEPHTRRLPFSTSYENKDDGR